MRDSLYLMDDVELAPPPAASAMEDDADGGAGGGAGGSGGGGDGGGGGGGSNESAGEPVAGAKPAAVAGPLKRPPGAYFLFCAERRAAVRAGNPGECPSGPPNPSLTPACAGADVTSIARLLGAEWKALDEAARAVCIGWHGACVCVVVDACGATRRRSRPARWR